ncbi:MAG: hypothetical protein K0S33_3621 [Bacteroidetes bacterium]|nr:hypothetical protein [Bacteroidota bacterium]
MKIYPEFSYMEYHIKEGITMEAEDVAASKEQVIRLFPGTMFYVYSEGAEFFTMTKKARELVASKDHLDNTIAIAFYTTNISIYLLGDLFNKINKPPVPTRIFRDRDTAREWLREQAVRNGMEPKF